MCVQYFSILIEYLFYYSSEHVCMFRALPFSCQMINMSQVCIYILNFCRNIFKTGKVINWHLSMYS